MPPRTNTAEPFADVHAPSQRSAPSAEGRNARLQQLLLQARRPSPETLRPLLTYLLFNGDLQCFISVLDDLDPNKIPTSSRLDVPTPPTADFERALDAVQDLTAIFYCLSYEAKRPDVTALRVRYGNLVMERWSGIMRWLIYLLLQARYYSNPSGALSMCTEALMRITVAEKKDLWQEELVYLPHTTDFIYLLLCQIDSRNTSYYYIPASPKGCLILNVLYEYIDDFSSYSNALARLKAVSPKTRDKIIASLVPRARHIAEFVTGIRKGEDLALNDRAEDMLDGIKSLYLLMFCTSQLLCDPALWKIFLKHDFLYEYASALDILSTKAHAFEEEARVASESDEEDESGRGVKKGLGESFWKLLGDTVAWFVKTLVMKRTPKPASSIPSALKGGIIHTALRCLLHLDPQADVVNRVIEEGIVPSLSFFTTRKGYLAVSQGYGGSEVGKGGKDELEELLFLAGRSSKAGKQVCREIMDSLVRGEQVFGPASQRRVRSAQMCGNRKHVARSTAGGTSNVRYWTCSGCHGVVYCSEACQQEDWDAFHSKECNRFTAWYKARQVDGQWIHYPVRRDYVLYIENLANEDLWPLVDRDTTRETSKRQIQSSSKRSRGQLYHPDSKISVFDFASFEGLALRSKYPLNAYHEACWQYINLEWQARVLQMYQDVEESNGWSCFVEGIFLRGEAMCVFVLVKLAWDENAMDGRRYRVEESVWRLGPRSVTEYIWDGPYGFPEDK